MCSTKYVRRIVLPSCCAYGPPRKMYCFWLNRARRRGSASLEPRGTVFWRRAPSCWPCPHQKPCPLPSDDWCHFTCRIARSRLHRQLKGADAPYEDEKFCYLAFGRSASNRAVSRVLRHPQIESGRITLRLCTRSGLITLPVRKRDGSLFKSARKASSGDAFPFEG